MWIVKLALRRPYTFIVLAILIMLLGRVLDRAHAHGHLSGYPHPGGRGDLEIHRLSPDEMATRLVLASERTAQTTVNDVEHTESQSLSGTSVVKYFFQPNVNEELSFAQITGCLADRPAPGAPGHHPAVHPCLQRLLGTHPPAGAVERHAIRGAVIRSRQQHLRTGLSTVQGASMPYPFGGLQRQVQVDLNPDALRAQGLSGNDVTAAISSQNSILPAGTQKIGDREYFVSVNSNPRTIAELNAMPVTTRNGSVIYVRDVAHVRDGYPPQTNIVRRDGKRGVLMSVLKTGSASTLDIIKEIKARIPRHQGFAARRVQH